MSGPLTRKEREAKRRAHHDAAIDALAAAWEGAWEDALACWSRYTRLSAPKLCRTSAEAEAQKLSASFAMIRLTDHAVVIDLEQILELGLGNHAIPILAHEIGHHVFCPGDLRDHGRVLARVRRALPSRPHLAPFVANLWSDLLINDRLQRSAGLDMVRVVRALGDADGSNAVWWLYLRTYELLWSLPRETLAARLEDPQIELDAQLASRLVRVYARDWVAGAGRFAALLSSHLLADDGAAARRKMAVWHDTAAVGSGGEDGDAALDGLVEIEDGELDDVVHPALDPELTGLAADALPTARGVRREIDRTLDGGQKKRDRYREPFEYRELLGALGVSKSEAEVAIRYYRERARPHLIRFPVRESPAAMEPHPEGVEVWEPGSPFERVDWIESVVRSPFVVPGYTTVQRMEGEAPGGDPAREPLDLYVGIDCSGSMPNPRRRTSYPVLAGTILALSALRAGARVNIVLSGEPGQSASTRGFERDERAVLAVLTDYLGTGYAFGIHRLEETFGADWPARARPVHIVVITDQDIFSPLEQGTKRNAERTGWDVARAARERAKGGATYVLHMPRGWQDEGVTRMQRDGWDVHRIYDWSELVAFARAFARDAWQHGSARAAAHASHASRR